MSEFLLSETKRPCWHCGKPTHRIEICFEAPLCSEACVHDKSLEYWRATFNIDPGAWEQSSVN